MVRVREQNRWHFDLILLLPPDPLRLSQFLWQYSQYVIRLHEVEFLLFLKFRVHNQYYFAYFNYSETVEDLRNCTKLFGLMNSVFNLSESLILFPLIRAWTKLPWLINPEIRSLLWREKYLIYLKCWALLQPFSMQILI